MKSNLITIVLLPIVYMIMIILCANSIVSLDYQKYSMTQLRLIKIKKHNVLSNNETNILSEKVFGNTHWIPANPNISIEFHQIHQDSILLNANEYLIN